jgi:hypothetical protein
VNKVTAQIKQELKLISTRLPTVLNETQEYHYLTGRELKEMEIEKDADGNQLVDDLKYKWSFPVQLASNHYRALRKAYETGGEPAVIQYIRKVKSMPVA